MKWLQNLGLINILGSNYLLFDDAIPIPQPHLNKPSRKSQALINLLVIPSTANIFSAGSQVTTKQGVIPCSFAALTRAIVS